MNGGKPVSRIGKEFNIPAGIRREASRLGLDAVGTGGGIDYVLRRFGAFVAVVQARGDAGSPPSLTASCDVQIVRDVDGDWTPCAKIGFKTTRAALRWVAGVEHIEAYGDWREDEASP